MSGASPNVGLYGRAIALATLLSVSQVTEAGAQTVEWSAEGRAGVAFPLGELAKLGDSGVALGVGVERTVGPRLSLRLSGLVETISKKLVAAGGAARDIFLFRYSLGVGYDLTAPDSRLALVARIGIGATTLDSDDYGLPDELAPGRPQDLGATRFSTDAGFRVGYSVLESVFPFLDAQWAAAFGREEDTEPLSLLSGGTVDPFSTFHSASVTAGVALSF